VIYLYRTSWLKGNVAVLSLTQTIYVSANAIWIMFFSLFLKDLGLSELELGYIFSIEAIVISVFLFIGGRIADIIGRKKTIIYGSIIFTSGPIIMSLGSTIQLVLLGYYIFFAGAGISSSAISILVLESSPSKSQGIAYMFVHRALPSLPPAITILIGGYLYEHGLFTISLLLASMCFSVIVIMNIFMLQETLSKNRNSLDHHDYTKKETKRLFLDKKLFLIIIIFGAYVTISNGLSWYIPIYLRNLGHSAVEYSYLISISTVAISIGSLLFGKLIDKFGPIKIATILWFIISVFSYAFSIQTYLIALILLYSIWSFFSTGITPIPSILIKNNYPQNVRTSALGTYRAFIRIISIFGPVTVGYITYYGADKPFLLLSGISLMSILILKITSRRYIYERFEEY